MWANLRLPACRQAVANGAVLLTREGGLPGAGQWTHQYGNSANTACSEDDRVRLPLGILWFGGPTNDNVLPRHGHGPIPQASGGRLILPGVDTLSARCVYTGRELWVRRFPGIGHPFTNLELEERHRQGTYVRMNTPPGGLGAHYIGSPFVSMPDAVYVRYKTRVFRLDPDTGDTQAEIRLPVDGDHRDAPDWGHLSVWEDVLLVTVNPHVFHEENQSGRFASMADIRSPEWSATSSSTLLAYDRHTGNLLWRREADVGFRHNAVVTGGGTVYIIDGLSEQAVALLQRRGTRPGKPVVVALDARTGNEKWRTSSDVFGTWLGYSVEHDVLIEAGRRGGLRELPDEPTDRIRAYRGADGAVLWDRALAYTGPIAIHGKTLLTAVYWRDSGKPYELSAEQHGRRLELLTGEDVLRQHPLTGESLPWTYWRTYGCGTANVSKHLVLFRSGAAGFADLENDGGTGSLGGFRAGCTASMIAADGVLLAPDYTRTCTCSYQNQTSLGLLHMPGFDVWTANHIGRGEGKVSRIGINLGAPGSRRDGNGTLWIEYPRSEAPAPDADVHVHPKKIGWYRKHSLLVDDPEGYHWVAASGGEGVETIRIENLASGRYRVRLYFAEPRFHRPEQRVFDVLLQETPVLKNVDVFRAAGGADKSLARQFDVHVDGTLILRLTKCPTSLAPPVISGVELIALEPVATVPARMPSQ
ncbi:MAG: malectin domain-containing carbohydrate-binding protein, partial [Thermoguttaceae bacterium]|jgi:outer membrane protein assembly factor BamB|nr:malectin domain-containing carbohydrate-binding protein [Thermoguttaceae bacterium]